MTNVDEKAMRILLADDDVSVRSSLSDFLRSEGYVIYEADSGLAALEILQRERLNMSFSIMDVDMPGMTGIEVVKVFRREVGTLPFILMSGDDSRERQAEAMAAGAFSLLTKPIGIDLLRYSMRRLLEHHYGRSPD